MTLRLRCSTALGPDGADEVRMNVQALEFGLLELFALTGQQMHMEPAGGTTFAADDLQTETLRKFCGGFFSNLQFQQFVTELGRLGIGS